MEPLHRGLVQSWCLGTFNTACSYYSVVENHFTSAGNILGCIDVFAFFSLLEVIKYQYSMLSVTNAKFQLSLRATYAIIANIVATSRTQLLTYDDVVELWGIRLTELLKSSIVEFGVCAFFRMLLL